MKRANKSGAAQTVVRSGPDGCWHGTPAQMQEDAEHAEWFFIGRGKRLHAFADGFVAWCGRGPVTVPGHVWVDAEPCRECLKMVRSANMDRMTCSVWTHSGRVRGCDTRRPAGYSRLIRLRQTATLWIGEDGTRWSKHGGWKSPRETRPLDRLDLDTVTQNAEHHARSEAT